MRQYQGMTLIGMLLTMAVVVIVGVTVMRIVPVYLENYSVSSSISALKKIPEAELSDDPIVASGVLRDKLVNQLYVNGVELPPENIKITPDGERSYKVSVQYQVIRPLVGNMSLMFDFDETQEVKFGNR